MRRTAVTASLCLLAALPGAAQAAVTPPLRAGLASCVPAADGAGGYAVFRASMPGAGPRGRVEMRLDLFQQRPGDRKPTRVSVPKLGVWERSAVGVPGLIVEKRVNALAAPASYRVRVRFHWIAPGGRVMRTVKKWTPFCEQPDPRPDLVPDGDIRVAQASDPRLVRYEMPVRNAGLGDVRQTFSARLFFDDVFQAGRAIDELASGERTIVGIEAAACRAGSFVQVDIDGRGAIEEASEKNNALRRPCPLAAS